MPNTRWRLNGNKMGTFFELLKTLFLPVISFAYIHRKHDDVWLGALIGLIFLYIGDFLYKIKNFSSTIEKLEEKLDLLEKEFNLKSEKSHALLKEEIKSCKKNTYMVADGVQENLDKKISFIKQILSKELRRELFSINETLNLHFPKNLNNDFTTLLIESIEKIPSDLTSKIDLLYRHPRDCASAQN